MAIQDVNAFQGVVIHRTVNTSAPTSGGGAVIPTSGQIWPPVYRQAEG